MTVNDYITFAAELKGLKGKDKVNRVNKVMDEVGVTHVKNRLIGHISRGFRQRVGLAQALVGDPQVLILDEPTVGLDPQQIIEIRQLIKNLAGKRTVILSSHILPEVSSLCHRVAIINKGNLIAENTPHRLAESLMGHQEIVLQVKGPKDKVYSVIEGLSGIKHYGKRILRRTYVNIPFNRNRKIYEKAFTPWLKTVFLYWDEIILYVP